MSSYGEFPHAALDRYLTQTPEDYFGYSDPPTECLECDATLDDENETGYCPEHRDSCTNVLSDGSICGKVKGIKQSRCEQCLEAEDIEGLVDQLRDEQELVEQWQAEHQGDEEMGYPGCMP